MVETDERQLQNDVTRAEQARALLDNLLLSDTFAALERSYLDAWRTTHVDDTAARERDFAHQRALMVERHIAARGIKDARVLQAMREDV